MAVPAAIETLDFAPQLEKRGYTLFTLTGQTLKSLASSGLSFSHTGNPYVIEDLPSLQAQVAVAMQPNRVFLEGTLHETWERQLAQLEQYKKKVEHDMPGVTVIAPNAADVAEIASQYLKRTGEYLLGPQYHHKSTRTTTRTLEFGKPLGMVTVGGFGDSKKSLTLGRFLPDARLDDLGLIPLLVSSKTAWNRQSSPVQPLTFTI